MEDDTIAMNGAAQPERQEDWRQNCQYLLDLMDNEGFDFCNLCEDDEAGINDIRALLSSEPDIDAEIERILADDTPVKETDRADILVCELGIAKGRNAMLVKALQASVEVMSAYKQRGYGDEVYMNALCRAIREGEKAILLHAETTSPQNNRGCST